MLSQGIKAFVSSIRSYSKHEASYLFRLQDLELVGLAKAFALLLMPKVAELKGKEKAVADRWQDREVYVSSRALSQLLFAVETFKLTSAPAREVGSLRIRRQNAGEAAQG